MKPPALNFLKNAIQPPPPPDEAGTETAKKWECPAIVPPYIWSLWLKLKIILSSVAVEPIMLLDGLAFSVMIVFVEDLQREKICRVNLNYTAEICNNEPDYPDENLNVQQSFSIFGMYNGIIMAFFPLFFILFMGAWSDKYGRKIPLLIATFGHLFWSAGYLINSMVPQWPVEYLLVSALFDSLGGGTVSFLTAANAYISDVTSEESRTSRVGLANSIWFLGGPMGTLLGRYLYKYGGYQVLFGTSVVMYIIAVVYVMFLPESHGPFATYKKPTEGEPHQEQEDHEEEKEKDIKKPAKITFKKNNEIEDPEVEISIWQMVKDFFNHGRIVDSFKCTFKQRGGLVRCFILLLILCNLLRRLGRGAYMYLFTRRVLAWKVTDYGLWVTYKNFIASLGSLVAVPLLSNGLGVSDNYLAMLGAFASVLDYILYGLVSEETYFLVWLAPMVATLVNSCTIAIRSMLSKFVSGDELGKVSAVMGALDGVMPMISFSLYAFVYHATVKSFPGAQFFFGAGSNLLMTIIFIIIIVATSTKSYSIDDLETAEGTKQVRPMSLRLYGDHRADPEQHYKVPEPEKDNANTQRATVVLSGVNFHLGTPKIQKKRDVVRRSRLESTKSLDRAVQQHKGNEKTMEKEKLEYTKSLENSVKLDRRKPLEATQSLDTISGDLKMGRLHFEKEIPFQKRMFKNRALGSGIQNQAYVSSEDENEGDIEIILTVKGFPVKENVTGVPAKENETRVPVRENEAST